MQMKHGASKENIGDMVTCFITRLLSDPIRATVFKSNGQVVNTCAQISGDIITKVVIMPAGRVLESVFTFGGNTRGCTMISSLWDVFWAKHTQ
jgi:effector-binding domain-containing protein